MPQRCGATTAIVALVAIAASTALPFCSRMRTPAFVANASALEIISTP